MAINFIVPRQSDQDLVSALLEVANTLKPHCEFSVRIDLPIQGAMQVSGELSDAQRIEVQNFLSLGGVIAQRVYLISATGHLALRVDRKLNEQWDQGTIADEWVQHFPSETRSNLPLIHARLLTESRRTLKTASTEAALADDGTQAWSKYRTAQTAVLASLQKTAEQVIVDVANKNAEIDKQRAQRFEELESMLRAEIATEREHLSRLHEQRTAELQTRVSAHDEREAQFLTKEARYVSRQKQDEQIKQIHRHPTADWPIALASCRNSG